MDIHLRQIVHAALVQLTGKLIEIEVLERRAGAQTGIAGRLVCIAVIGVVAGQARGLAAVGALHLIQHAAVQRIQHRLGRGQYIAALAGHVAQVHHVGVALLAGVAAVVLAAVRHAGKPREEGRVLAGGAQRLRAVALIGRQQRPDLGQVGERQRHTVLRARQLAAGVVRIADGASQSGAVHGRLFRQRAHPVGVVPAVARLRLLRRHQIAAQVAEGVSHVHRGHQAGVKAHQLHRLLPRLQRRLPHLGKRGVHLVQRQGVVVVQLVKSRAGHRAAAVVPEHHRRLVGGVAVLGKLQKRRQRLAVAHTGRGLLVHQLQSLAVVHEALQLGGIHHVVLPLGSAAGLDDHRHVLRQLHLHQLAEVRGGAAAPGLQIAAAEVPVYRPAAAVLRRIVVRRTGLIAAGGQRQGHDQRHHQRENFLLHIQIPSSCFFLAANSSSVMTPVSTSILYFCSSATVSTTGAAA